MKIASTGDCLPSGTTGSQPFGRYAPKFLRPGFDLLAPHYLWMERLLAGRALQRCRTAFLPETLNAKSALLLGEGNGRFLSEFLRVNETAAVTCVDSSAKMLELARRQVVRTGTNPDRLAFVRADLLDEEETAWHRGPFDLIVTHFFLDCFRGDQLSLLLPRIADQASSKANWLLADFHLPAQGFWRWRARLILWIAYRFFRVVTRLPARALPDPAPLLMEIGFERRAQKLFQHHLLHSDLWEN